MEEPKNPYVIGNSVGNSPAFVGRTDVFEKVLSVVCKENNQNAIVLFGQRRIGKTSVLLELKALLEKAKLPKQWNGLPVFVDLQNKANGLPVFVDLQNKANWPLTKLLQEIAFKISDIVPDVISDLGSEAETTFSNVWLPNVLKNLPSGKSIVLLFDEFEALAPTQQQNPHNFFPYLCDLLDDLDNNIDWQRLTFVFAIGRNLRDFNNVTPLFKSIISKPVSLLEYEEMVKLIQLSETNNTLKWSKEAIDKIWQQTHGHPLITQCLCHNIWETASHNNELNHTVTLEKVNVEIPKTLEMTDHIIGWLWDGLGPAERVVASVLAEEASVSMTEVQLKALLKESGVQVMIQELQDAKNLLKKFDFIDEIKAGIYSFRVELFRRWVEENEPISRVREEIDNINPEATESYRTGIELKDREQLDEACECLRDAIDKNPNHAKASALLANILLDQGKIEESCRQMEKLYKYQLDAVQDRFIQRLLDLAKKEEDKSKQQKLYDQIWELDSEHEEVKKIWEQKGDEAYEARELNTALKHYKKAGTDDKVIEVQWTMQCQALPSEKIHNWYEQAKIALKNSDTQKAQSLFTRILAKEPTHKEAVQELYSMNIPPVRRSKWPFVINAIVLVILVVFSISGVWLHFQKQAIQQELIIAQDKLKRFEDLPNRLENFVPKLQQGLYAVVVGSYGDKFEGVAQKEVEKIQQRYPILGAGKFQIPDEDESWLVHLGNFYTRESAEQLEDKATNELNFDEVSIVETRKIAKKDREDIASTEDFASTLKKGTSVVVVSSYGRSFNILAQKAVEKLQKLHPTLGAGKFLDGEFWIVHLGQFYAKESAKQLIEKAKKDWNFHDAFVLNTGRTNIPPPPDGGINIPPPESQKTLPEFLETLKEGSYVIVVQTYGSRFEKYARNLVAQLNDNHPKLEADKFKIGSQWLVSIGKGYSRESAQALKQYAIAHKIVEDAYIRKR
jgi:tetratricopeptide (TPR) repeat protein